MGYFEDSLNFSVKKFYRNTYVLIVLDRLSDRERLWNYTFRNGFLRISNIPLEPFYIYRVLILYFSCTRMNILLDFRVDVTIT